MVKPRVNQATIAGSVKTIALKEDNFVVFNLTVPYKKFEFNVKVVCSLSFQQKNALAYIIQENIGKWLFVTGSIFFLNGILHIDATDFKFGDSFISIDKALIQREEDAKSDIPID